MHKSVKMGEITIVSGKWGGRSIMTPEGVATRPLLSRLRKSLADILRPRLHGASVMELFGGSGAIALELLSNGAESAVIVELDEAVCRLIGSNIKKLGANAKVEQGDCLQIIPKYAAAGAKFDVVIVAPPYGAGLQSKAMTALAYRPLVKNGGLAIVQRELNEPFWTPRDGFGQVETRRYGRTVFDFYTWNK